MTYEAIMKANEAIRTTTIEKMNRKTNEVSRSEYAEVHQKIKAFRMVYPCGTISTELLSCKDGVAIIKASVYGHDNNLLGTGTAYEKEGSSFINDTSYIENCETSAVGRALAMCGFGIDLGVASYEEVANAKLNQKDSEKKNDPAPKVKAEVVKETPKKKVAGYPRREAMLEVAKKHYPDGSANLKALLDHFKAESLESLTDEQLAVIYEKMGGR